MDDQKLFDFSDKIMNENLSWGPQIQNYKNVVLIKIFKEEFQFSE